MNSSVNMIRFAFPIPFPFSLFLSAGVSNSKRIVLLVEKIITQKRILDIRTYILYANPSRHLGIHELQLNTFLLDYFRPQGYENNKEVAISIRRV